MSKRLALTADFVHFTLTRFGQYSSGIRDLLAEFVRALYAIAIACPFVQNGALYRLQFTKMLSADIEIVPMCTKCSRPRLLGGRRLVKRNPYTVHMQPRCFSRSRSGRLL